MSEPYALLDASSAEVAVELLLRCCGSTRWANDMAARRPFGSRDALHAAAAAAWATLSPDDYLEAFARHPRIGEQTPAAGGGHSTAGWSRDEQSEASRADAATRSGLRAASLAYERRFGFVFLVCATGKGAGEILELLDARVHNGVEAELRIAAAEQAKITLLRLDKLGK